MPNDLLTATSTSPLSYLLSTDHNCLIYVWNMSHAMHETPDYWQRPACNLHATALQHGIKQRPAKITSLRGGYLSTSHTRGARSVIDLKVRLAAPYSGTLLRLAPRVMETEMDMFIVACSSADQVCPLVAR